MFLLGFFSLLSSENKITWHCVDDIVEYGNPFIKGYSSLQAVERCCSARSEQRQRVVIPPSHVRMKTLLNSFAAFK